MDARRWVRPRPHRLSHVRAAGESPVSPLGQIEAGKNVGCQLEPLHASEPVGSEPVRAERAPGAPLVAHAPFAEAFADARASARHPARRHHLLRAYRPTACRIQAVRQFFFERKTYLTLTPFPLSLSRF